MGQTPTHKPIDVREPTVFWGKFGFEFVFFAIPPPRFACHIPLQYEGGLLWSDAFRESDVLLVTLERAH